jgi:hypothetical protein
MNSKHKMTTTIFLTRGLLYSNPVTKIEFQKEAANQYTNLQLILKVAVQA